MVCNTCGDKKPKNDSRSFPKATVEIVNPKELALLRKVVVPASLGDDVTNPPAVGKYCNVILYYEANDQVYLYSSDGIPTRITVDITELKKQIAKVAADLVTETDERKAADKDIWDEIETIEAASDVVDVVGTYAELQAYDTSKLHDNDLIKVLQDETRDDAITYYRWNGSAFTYVGAEGPYYTASETDTLLAAKQDTLIAGANIQIAADGKTISATDTTYTHFTGATASTDGVQGLVPGPLAGDENKVLKGDGTWGTISSAANTIFYMNASESGSTRHLYKASDMTGLVTMQDIIDANDEGQVIVRISTSVTPSNYSDMYLQNAYVASGDYQMIFLDNQYYYSFDATQTSANTFQFAKSEVQRKLTAGTNIQINGNTISATDTTYSAFVGATSSVAGSAGLVPAPTTADPDKFLKGDGTWGDVASSTVYYVASYPDNTASDLPLTLYADKGLTTPVNGETVATAFNRGDDIYVAYTAHSSFIEDVTTYFHAIYSEVPDDPTDYESFDENGLFFTIVSRDMSLSWTISTYSNVATTNGFKLNAHRQQHLTAGNNINITSQGVISATDTTYSAFAGATAQQAGSAGLVPAPTTSDPDKYLKGDGTWATLPGANNISSNDWNTLWQ